MDAYSSRQSCAAAAHTPILATVASGASRDSCLFRHFGPHCLRVEAAVFAMLDALSEDYDGGLWDFYELSNGGFYMAPVAATRFRLRCEGNGYEGEVGADAVGIVACLMALSHLSFQVTDGRIAAAFHQLRAFALGHGEARAIFRAID